MKFLVAFVVVLAFASCKPKPEENTPILLPSDSTMSDPNAPRSM